MLGAASSTNTNHPKEVYFGSDKFKTLNSMLQNLGVTVYFEDSVTVFPEPALGLGSVITVERATVVSVQDGRKTVTYRTWSETVGDLLKEKNIPIGSDDIVKPAISSKISSDLPVAITRVNETNVDEIIKLPYGTSTKNDANLEKGKQKIETKGVNGSKKRVYHLRRENGVLVSKVLVKDTVTLEPIDEVIIKGTKPPLNLISSGKYKETINVAAEKYRTDATVLYKLMILESNGNYKSVGGGGRYKGLFQYTDGAWLSMSSKAGYSGANIFDPAAQINVTAWAITHGYKSKWPSL